MPGSISIASLVALGGCGVFSSPVPPGRSVREVYDAPRHPDTELRIERDPAPGQGARTRAVIYPPKIFAVWVSEHIDPDRDIKIGPHWVYLKLRDSSWFPEPIDREPETTDSIAPGELELLAPALSRDRVGRFLLPYRPLEKETKP